MIRRDLKLLSLFLMILVACMYVLSKAQAQNLPTHLPEIRYHLTARPWQPLSVPPQRYLEVIEGVCRAAERFQDGKGAVIDPFLRREHQYSTPYFAFAVGTLVQAGYAMDLLDAGVQAMEHATASFAGGSGRIPDQHGEFFIPPLTEALDLYQAHVDETTRRRWHDRMKTPINEILRDDYGRLNNWRTYAMKGEWLRARHGLVDPEEAVAFIERAWHHQTQKERIGLDQWNLYQDWSSDPQSHAVEAVGRGNLIALLAAGYDGPSAEEMWRYVRRGTQTSLLLQSPDGQCPPNGRTDNHIFNDVLYQLIFEVMAEDALGRNHTHLAAQYRHAAMLSFQSIQRWRREDEPWKGSFYITKNAFAPVLRVGHQPASQWGNYNGAVMLHLAEAYLARRSNLEEAPAPTEIGGYAFRTDARFSTFIANAGGMQVFANLRGASVTKYNRSWTPLGVVRFSRAGWDSRLGPSDGEHDPQAGSRVIYSRGTHESPHDFRTGSGITFAPEWIEQDRWIRMADVHQHYQAEATVTLAHPLLVRFHLTYHYVTGRGGPYFRHEFTLTPDGVWTRLIPLQPGTYGVTVPLLENDGTPLDIRIGEGIASTTYPNEADEQHFISLNHDAVLDVKSESLRSTYGWLKSVRFQTAQDSIDIFVYPRGVGDPTASEVKESFQRTEEGFSSAIAEVNGTLYKGRTSAGGFGAGIDLDDDGEQEVLFDQECGFILQLKRSVPHAVETDRDVVMTYEDQAVSLKAYTPFFMEQPQEQD